MIRLEQCKRTDPRYLAIRERHYVPNNGACGRQLHYLIWCENNLAGIISAGSAAYAVKSRDLFFGFDRSNRNLKLGMIVNNTVFRLETQQRNLATRVLKLWRQRVEQDWWKRYAQRVIGFETFVVETSWRTGALYRADNWTLLGRTASGKLVYCRNTKTRGSDYRISLVAVPWAAETSVLSGGAPEAT